MSEREPGQTLWDALSDTDAAKAAWSYLPPDVKAIYARGESVIRAEQKKREEAMMDSQYRAGAQAGWNAAQADNPEKAFATLIASRAGCLAAIRADQKERDARIAESRVSHDTDWDTSYWNQCAENIAAAIRKGE